VLFSIKKLPKSPNAGGSAKGVGRKISRGANGKKDRKIAKKYIPTIYLLITKNNTIKPLPGGGSNGKRPKNKSLYVLYLYHVGKSRRSTAPLPTPMGSAPRPPHE